ncbi:MAG: S41 family peptidase [Deltaproteobacteria bacterium]|nr:S41 family peptidase [Deltaproteobacteria bacterium]
MKRKSFAWTLFLSLFILVVVGVTHESGVQAKGETYEQLNIFSEVLHMVQQNYVEKVDTKKLVYGAIKGMLNALDPHSSFMEPDTYKELQVDTRGKFGGIGIQISIRDKQLTIIAPIEDTPGDRVGLKAGDVILKVDDEWTKDLSLMDAVKLMRGKPGTRVTLTIMRKEFKRPKKFKITRAVIKVKSVKYKLLEGGIGYLRLSQFQQDSGKEIGNGMQKLLKEEKIHGLILDLRNNPGGLLDEAVKVCGKFLPKGTLVVYTKGRAQGRHDYKVRGAFDYPRLPMVVLINGGSASASEITAGALQDWGRAIIMGTQSFGKGSVQTVVPLSDGSGLRLTTAKYYTPRDKSIQNVGITPDIVVEENVIVKAAPDEFHHIKEADLKNHLDNPDVKAAPPAKKKESSPSAEEGPEAEKKSPQDYQLQQAVDLLKAWRVFEKIKPAFATK